MAWCVWLMENSYGAESDMTAETVQFKGLFVKKGMCWCGDWIRE